MKPLCKCGMAAQRDGNCKRCRLKLLGASKRKYVFTAAMDAEIRANYAAAGSVKGLRDRNRAFALKYGFKGRVVTNRALDLGVSALGVKRPWTPEEIVFVQANSGKLSRDTIARKLKRSVSAVKHRMDLLGLIQPHPTHGYSQHKLASLMGVDADHIRRWLRAGLLKDDEQKRILITSVRTFLVEHPDQYRLSMVNDGWFKTLVFPRFREHLLGRQITFAVDPLERKRGSGSISSHTIRRMTDFAGGRRSA